MPGAAHSFTTEVHPDAETAARAVLARLAEVVERCRAAGRAACLALPTGRTPLPVFEELRDAVAAGSLDLDGCQVFALDEYHPLAPDHPASFTRYFDEQLLEHVDLGSGAAHVPDGLCPQERVSAHCAAYERAIVDAGGLDLALLGLGANGHVAFNEPGSPLDGRTARRALAESTRRDAELAFGDPAAVPTHGLSMGLGTLSEARQVIVLATGAGKAGVVARLLADDGEQLPARQLLAATGGLLVLDAAAAALARAQPGLLP